MTRGEKIGLLLLGAAAWAGAVERREIRKAIKRRLQLFPDEDAPPVVPGASSPGTTAPPRGPTSTPRPTANIFPDGQHYHLVTSTGLLLGVFDTVEMATKVAATLGYTAVQP